MSRRRTRIWVPKKSALQLRAEVGGFPVLRLAGTEPRQPSTRDARMRYVSS